MGSGRPIPFTRLKFYLSFRIPLLRLLHFPFCICNGDAGGKAEGGKQVGWGREEWPCGQEGPGRVTWPFPVCPAVTSPTVL